MAYTLANLQTDIRNYTEVDDTVFSDSVLDPIIKNAENRIYREADSDDNRFYATSTLVAGNRYVTIPSDLRSIRYVQLKDTNVTPNAQTFLEKKDASYMATFYDTPDTQSGIPKYYANWDANFWVVAPTPNANYEITLAYVKQPFSITDTTQPTGAAAATINTASGYTITKVDDNNYTFVSGVTASATQEGGGDIASAGPVTVSA